MKKNLFFISLILAFAFLSCNKEKTSNDLQQQAGMELPTKAVAYIADNYPDADIEFVFALKNSSVSYLVTMTTSEELAFSNNGDFMGNGEQFHHGQMEGDTIYGHHHGGHHGGGIPVDSLSSVIREYISANYPEYIILHARLDSICPDGAVTEVMLGKPETRPLKVIFGEGDAFLMTSERVPYEDVPQAIKDYIALNFDDSIRCKKASELTLADNSLQYFIYLRIERTVEKLRMSADGALVCEETDTLPHGGGHPGGPHPHHGWIPIDSLSATIVDYASNNYPDYTIMRARYDSICTEGTVIKVSLAKEDTRPFDLVFVTDDMFMFTSGMVHFWDLPQSVRDYISENYQGWGHDGKAEKYLLPDATVHYMIFLKRPHEHKRVRLAEDGTLLCEL